MSNDLAVRRAHKVFVVAETTKGTLKVPGAANNVIPVGLAMINQTPTFTDSEEIQNTRDIIDRFQDRMPPADWSLSCLLRPVSAGVAPQEDALLLALMGTKTIVGATSVTYSQAIDKPSVSIWIQYDNTVRFLSGATVSSMAGSASNKGAFQLDFSGRGMKAGTVGTQNLSSAALAGATSLIVDDASCYSVGGLIETYDVTAGTVDNNTNAGYAISAVNTTTNTLTVAAITAALDIDDVIRPWLPVGTIIGAPVENRKTTVSIGGTPTNVKTLSINIEDPAAYIEDEITTSGFVEDYVPDTRKISGSFASLMRNNDAKYFVDNAVGTKVAISLVVGDTAGSRVTFTMPICSLDVPTVSDSSPTVSLDMAYMALGASTAGEDSLTIAYT